MAAKLLLFPWKAVLLNFSIGGTLKRSTSAVWIFIMDFHQKRQSRYSSGVVCLGLAGEVFFLGLLFFWKNVLVASTAFSSLLCIRQASNFFNVIKKRESITQHHMLCKICLNCALNFGKQQESKENPVLYYCQATLLNVQPSEISWLTYFPT